MLDACDRHVRRHVKAKSNSTQKPVRLAAYPKLPTQLMKRNGGNQRRQMRGLRKRLQKGPLRAMRTGVLLRR